jgi:hypothetical protein
MQKLEAATTILHASKQNNQTFNNKKSIFLNQLALVSSHLKPKD